LLEITDFYAKIKKKEANFYTTMAYALYFPAGFKLRDAQLLAIMLALYVSEKCPQLRGPMLQVSTGEGKTVIIAVLAIVRQLIAQIRHNKKQFIGVITSTPILAKEGAESMRGLYTVFGLSIDHICHEDEDDKAWVLAHNSLYT
jgi:hypothetical protein